MTKNKLIHIRLDSNEAVKSRRDVLTTEMDLIKIAKAIKHYRILRLKELQFKIDLQKKIKEFHTSTRKLKLLLPKMEIPKILKKHEKEMHNHELDKKVEKIKNEEVKNKMPLKKQGKKTYKQIKPVTDDFEKQLKEIQGKLANLE